MNWVELESVDQLKAIKEGSAENKVLIFKHSTRCAISQMALTRLEKDWRPEEMKAVKLYFLDLLKHKDLSNHIALEFSVEHESPQVLLIENGLSVYDRSHTDIRYAELAGIATKKTATN